MEIINKLENSKIIKRIFFALVGTVFLAISSKIKIPFYPVPMTMQTFMVLVIGIIFGWKLGVFTILLYLFEGIIWSSCFFWITRKGIGIIYFTGPTMGYLIGFVFATFLAGYFNYNKNFFLNFLKLIISVSIIYILGLIWLGILIGWDKPIFELGAKPFLLAELFKISLIALLLASLKKAKKFI